MGIEALDRTLPVSDSPGLDTFDARLADITSLVQEGNFADAAKAIDEVFAEDVFDVRLLGYYAYWNFTEGGVAGLGAVFRVLNRCMTENWGALGPIKNKEKHTKTALVFLLKQLLRVVGREEENKGEAWQSWTSAVSSEDVEAMLEDVDELTRATSTMLDDQAGPVVENLGKLRKWLVGFQKVVYTAPEPEPEPEPEEETEGAAAAPAANGAAHPAGETVSGSVHLALLVRKLDAFQKLVEAEKLAQAAIVADDVFSTLNNFDPTLYFPDLFAPFVKAFAMNVGRLSDYAEQRESAEWKAMSDLFKVDIDSFVEL